MHANNCDNEHHNNNKKKEKKSEMQAVYTLYTHANAAYTLSNIYIHAFKLYYAYSYYVVIECNFHKFLTHTHVQMQKCVYTA